MTTVNNTQNSINPHMKFQPTKKGVVQVPNVYQYSLHDELKLGETQYRQILKSMNRSRLAVIAEKHPNLKSNIVSIFKLTTLIFLSWMGARYRHSIPFLKSFCKKPKNTPPNFFKDLEKVWQSIVKK